MSNAIPFAPAYDDLPQTLAVFPLTGVLLLPMGTLPLNIFEPRYLQMVADAMAGSRMIGMVQPLIPGGAANARPELYNMGCAGKITEFKETEDGRFEITLKGVCRFGVEAEMDTLTPYRIVRPDWQPFQADLAIPPEPALDRAHLTELLRAYFGVNDMDCDWKKVEDAPVHRLLTCLPMVCPFAPKEKQALLEAPDMATRAEMLVTLLQLALHETKAIDKGHSHH